jgi:hypothetical protein
MGEAVNEDVKNQWVDALRSGRYRQGTQYLHRIVDGEPYYCCLGVLCSLLASPDNVVASSNGSVCTYEGDSQLLPEKVVKAAGMRDNEGTFRLIEDDDTDKELWAINDHDGRSFAEIAEIIERVWEQL